MLVTVSLWCAVFLFSLMIMLFVREPLALTLMFSAANAAIAGAFGVSLVFSACVFLASYAVLLAAILITDTAIKRLWKNGNVDNAQKNGKK